MRRHHLLLTFTAGLALPWAAACGNGTPDNVVRVSGHVEATEVRVADFARAVRLIDITNAAAERDVPVVALKVGRTETSGSLVTAHSGALARPPSTAEISNASAVSAAERPDKGQPTGQNAVATEAE